MKILHITMLSLAAAATAVAGVKSQVTVIAPPPTVPMIAPPPTLSEQGWYAEAAGFVGRSNQNILRGTDNLLPNLAKRVDIIGGDLTIGYKLDASNALQLRVGYGYGADTVSTDMQGWTQKSKIRAHTFTLMPGYRFTCDLDDSWALYGAVHAGVSNQSLKGSLVNFSGTGANASSSEINVHDSDYGFAYSAEVGVRYNITAGLYSFLAYEFRGSTSEPRFSDYDVKTRAQTYHVIRLGMGCEF